MFLINQRDLDKIGDPKYQGSSTMARRKRDTKTKDLFAYADDNLRPTIVYMATNRINGKRYVGITVRLAARKAAHFHDAKRGADGYFHRAIRKHGADAFEFAIIRRCGSYKEAALCEIAMIAALKPEYNMSFGGDGIAGIGTRATPETREKLRAAQLRNPARYWLGKTRSAESIAKRTETRARNPVRPWLGKQRSPETIAKIAAKKRKWVVCLNDGKRYHGLRAAAEAYGLSCHRSIADVCIGRAKQLRGYRFVYEAPSPR